MCMVNVLSRKGDGRPQEGRMEAAACAEGSVCPTTSGERDRAAAVSAAGRARGRDTERKRLEL